MLNHKGIPALQPDLDLNNFLKDADRLFAADAWLQEIIQNALRAGATRLEFLRQGDDLVVSDNGTGLQPHDWTTAFCISRSGWNDQVKATQRPAGMGLFSLLLKFELTLESNGIQVHTTPDAVRACEQFVPKDSSLSTGTRLTLHHGWKAFLQNLGIIAGGKAIACCTPMSLPKGATWEEVSKLLKERYKVHAQTFQNYFGAAIYNANRQYVSLFIPDLGIDETIATAPWAAKIFDPAYHNTLTFHEEGIVQGRIEQVATTIPAPRVLTEDYFVTLHIDEVNPNLWRRTEETLIFHGRYVTYPKINDGVVRPVIHIFGRSPIDVRHPDRTHIIENEAWTKFVQNVIQPLYQQYKDHAKAAEGAVEVPVLNICTEVQSQNEEDSVFYRNTLEKNWYLHKVLENGVPLVLQDEPDLPFARGKWQRIPKIYGKLDFITDIDFTSADDGPRTQGLPEKRPAYMLNLARIAEQLAHEGQITFGQRRNREVGHEETNLGPLTPKFRSAYEMVLIFGPLLEKKILNPSQGLHDIEIYKDIGLKVDDRTWTIQEPFITLADNPWDIGQPRYDNVTFYANEAFARLCKENPQEAFDLFAQAGNDAYVEIENEFGHVEYDEDDFDYQKPFHRAESFFLKTPLTEQFADIVNKFLSEQNRDWKDHAFHGKTHVKHVRFDKNRLEIRATLETSMCSIKANIEGDQQHFAVTPRTKRAKCA